MATEAIRIQVSASGAQRVEKQIDRIGGASDKSAKAVDRLQGLLAKLAAGVGVSRLAQSFARLADQATQLQNRLKTVTNSASQLARVQGQLRDIANETRSEYGSIVELFTRVATSAGELGRSEQELIRFTKSLSQEVQLSGASAAEASNALIQLSQGLASGTLRGDELRSVLEQLPTVADRIAKSLGVTRGQLRELGSEGKLTANQIIDAFLSAETSIQNRFNQLAPTIGGAFIVLRNNILTAVSNFDQATGASQSFAQAILAAANNVEQLAVAIGTTLAIVAIPAAIRALGALKAVLLKHPLGIIAVVVASAVGALAGFRDEIAATADGMASLGDFGRATLDVLTQRFDTVARVVSTIRDQVVRVFEGLGNFNFSIEGAARGLATVADLAVSVVRGLFDGARAFLSTFFEVLDARWGRVFTNLGKLVDNLVQGFIAGVNKLVELFNSIVPFISQFAGAIVEQAPKLDPEQFRTSLDFATGGISEALIAGARAAANEFNNNLSGRGQFQGFRNLVDQISERARQIGQERQLNEQLAALMPEQVRLLNEFQSLTAQQQALIGPLQALTVEQKQQLVTALQLAANVGNIAQGFATDASAVVSRLGELGTGILQLLDQIASGTRDGANVAIDEAKRVLGAGAAEVGRVVFTSFLSAFSGGLGGLASNLAGAAGAAGSRALNLGTGNADPNVPDPALSSQLRAIEDATRRVQILNEQIARIGSTAQGSFAQAGSAAAGFGSATTNIGQQINNVFSNAFSSLENALVSFVQTGKIDFKSLINAMLADLARLFIRMLIIQPLMGFFGGIFGGFGFGFSQGGLVGGLGSGGGFGGLPGFARGGLVQGDFKSAINSLPGYATGGGIVPGFGGSTADTMLARLSSGEFVVRASSAGPNLSALNYINRTGMMPKSSMGGATFINTTNITQNFNGGGPGGNGQQAADGQASADHIASVVRQTVVEVLRQEQRPGGILSGQQVR